MSRATKQSAVPSRPNTPPRRAGSGASRHLVRATTGCIGLKESRHRLEEDLADLLENTTIGLLWIDAKGRLLRANQALFDRLGRAPQECLGRALAAFCHDPSAINDLLSGLVERKVIRNFRIRIQLPDGALRPVLLDGRAAFKRGRFLRAVLFLRDITARVELESEILQISEREQQHLGRELHDSLGQQLHAVSYLAALLHRTLDEQCRPEAADARHLNKLLDEALELTRGLAHGLQPVKPVPEGLMLALRELAARVRTLYGMDCRFECRRPVFMANVSVATHLYRIAQEAVNNAVKHACPSRIRISLTRGPQRIVLGVRDNGMGLRRVRLGRKGMGLHIMQYRADVIDGSLVIQKAPKRGTEVVCSVPAETDDRCRQTRR